jgi:hypothetical protein
VAAGNNNRFLTIGAAVGSLVLLAAVVFFLWPSDPTDYALTSGREQADGETVGWVSKVESNTIHVNSGPFGGGVVPLVVTRNTRITVGSKEGWFEDIRPGGQVKVAYEVYHGKRLARTVELLVDEGPRRPGRVEPRLKSAVSGASTDRAPTTKAAATSTPTPEAPAAPAAKAPEPAAPTATAPRITTPPAVASPTPAARPAWPLKPALPPAADARPAPKPEPPRAQATEPSGSQRVPTSAPPRGTAAAENGSRSPEAARPASPAPSATPGRTAEPARTPDGGESTDGSAAVDWLLKGRR